ncbi:hypothetical protein, partial [Ramlibacter sp.]|uniref:hypothetical protein n=1 Tax=Ramlibacter sp. TaxID=1917967 RepID=UPI002630A82B
LGAIDSTAAHNATHSAIVPGAEGADGHSLPGAAGDIALMRGVLAHLVGESPSWPLARRAPGVAVPEALNRLDCG